MNILATPIDGQLPSLADILPGKPMITLLPNHGEPAPVTQCEELERRHDNMKIYHGRKSLKEELHPLCKRQPIRILDKINKTRCPDIILNRELEPLSYLVDKPIATFA